MDEPAVFSKLLLDLVIVEEGQGNGCLANSTSTNESNGCEVFGKADNLLDEIITSKAGWWWGRQFSQWDARSTFETMNYMVFETTDLV